MVFDFKALLDGLMRNNVGLGGIRLLATVTVDNGKVGISPTGQGYSLQGEPPAETGPSRRWLRVMNWQDPAGIRVEIEGGSLECLE